MAFSDWAKAKREIFVACDLSGFLKAHYSLLGSAAAPRGAEQSPVMATCRVAADLGESSSFFYPFLLFPLPLPLTFLQPFHRVSLCSYFNEPPPSTPPDLFLFLVHAVQPLRRPKLVLTKMSQWRVFINIFAIQILFLYALHKTAWGCRAWKPSVHPLAETQELFGSTSGKQQWCRPFKYLPNCVEQSGLDSISSSCSILVVYRKCINFWNTRLWVNFLFKPNCTQLASNDILDIDLLALQTLERQHPSSFPSSFSSTSTWKKLELFQCEAATLKQLTPFLIPLNHTQVQMQSG